MKEKTKFSVVRDRFRRLASEYDNPKFMLEVAGTAKALITHRTLLGRSVTGAPFAPYSTTPTYIPIDNRPPGYPIPTGGRATRGGKSRYYEGGWKSYKESIGRGGTPNLSVSGEMLGDIQARPSGPMRAVLYFGSNLSAAKAHGHHFGTVVPEREWFDVAETPVEIATLNQRLVDLTREYIANAGLNAGVRAA